MYSTHLKSNLTLQVYSVGVVYLLKNRLRVALNEKGGTCFHSKVLPMEVSLFLSNVVRVG